MFFLLQIKKSFTDTSVVMSEAKFSVIKKENVIKAVYPKFGGFTIHNLFEFFMVFVVLCGVASVLLFMLVPKLKVMMHNA